MKCTRGNCHFISKTYTCGILTSHCKDPNCPFFKTTKKFLDDQQKVQDRLRRIGMEL